MMCRSIRQDTTLEMLLGLSPLSEEMVRPAVQVEEACTGVFVITLDEQLHCDCCARKYIRAFRAQLPLLDGHLVFDLAACQALSSRLIGLFMELFDCQRRNRRALVFVNTNSLLQRRMSLLVPHQTFRFFDSLQTCFDVLRISPESILPKAPSPRHRQSLKTPAAAAVYRTAVRINENTKSEVRMYDSHRDKPAYARNGQSLTRMRLWLDEVQSVR